MSNLRIEGLVARARGWTEADLRKFPTATLELIDALAAALVAAWPGDAPADRLREAAEYALDYLVASNQRFNVDPTAIDKLERALAPIDAPWVAALSLHKEGAPTFDKWFDLWDQTHDPFEQKCFKELERKFCNVLQYVTENVPSAEWLKGFNAVALASLAGRAEQADAPKEQL